MGKQKTGRQAWEPGIERKLFYYSKFTTFQRSRMEKSPSFTSLSEKVKNYYLKLINKEISM